MNLNDPIFWLFALTLCSIALITEVSHFFHVLIMTRQRLWRYLFVVIPMAKCIWAFAVVWYILNTASPFLPGTGIIFFGGTRHFFIRIFLPLIRLCQLQIGIVIISFTIMLFLERIALPHNDRDPSLTLTKNRLLLAN